jgi:hypothetical protein
MNAYTTPKGRTVKVGDLYRDVRRVDARTLRVDAIDGPYRDWKGTTRCPVHYTVVAQAGGKTPSPLSKTIEADRLTNPALFVLVGAVS